MTLSKSLVVESLKPCSAVERASDSVVSDEHGAHVKFDKEPILEAESVEKFDKSIEHSRAFDRYWLSALCLASTAYYLETTKRNTHVKFLLSVKVNLVLSVKESDLC